MRRCRRCARDIPAGTTAYALEFRMYADFDGVIDPRDEESFDRALAAALAEDQGTLEDQVFMEGRSVLCPGCREETLEALGFSGASEVREGGEAPDEEEDDTVH